MMVDEFYFHHRRGLGRWESWGHPVDTILFLSCFLYTILVPYSSHSQTVFIILSILSSLIIAKDEFIHQQQSSGAENFLHAFLFMIHPLSLYVLFEFWKTQQMSLIMTQALIIFVFLLYQVLYWNIFKREKYVIKN